LNHHSGLLALTSVDMRDVLAAEQTGHTNAMLAIEVWLYRLRSSITAMTAALGGLDVLAFSGGIRQHAAELRRRTEDAPGLLRLAVAPAFNAAVVPNPDTDISAADAAAPTTVVHSRKETVIAGQVRATLGVEPG
jgi:acetate kinase